MDPYVGEIRMFGGSFAPAGWLMCDGRVVGIADYEVLFSLIGTTYGGDGRTTFGLPDLCGRVPLQRSSDYPLGLKDGVEQVTLTQQDLAEHTHAANTKAANGNSSAPAGRFWAGNAEYTCYAKTAPDKQFAASAIGAVGGNEPHENMMPFLTVSFIIAVAGIYPSN